jgi:vancomycin resistance protein YoaR
MKRLYLLIWFLPFILASVCWATYPFADQICSKTLSLTDLSMIQKRNIQVAARAIDGTVLRPGEEFSFNKIVGPRTDARGYRAAPSYLGPENTATIGGGICLVSSAVYQAALESGLEVTQRVPHLRTIKTVPAGLDAAVWYGQADLKFKNTLSVPIQINTEWNRQTLKITIVGKDEHKEKIQLERVVTRRTQSQVVVELMRRTGSEAVLVSRDLYKIAN